MGCSRSKQKLSPEQYADIMRDLIINDGSQKDKLEKLCSAGYKILELMRNKNLYNKKDRITIENLYQKAICKHQKYKILKKNRLNITL